METKRKVSTEVMGMIGGTATVLALILTPMFYLGAKMDTHRNEFRNDMNEFRNDMNEFRKETKDFHGRLCAIEERSRK